MGLWPFTKKSGEPRPVVEADAILRKPSRASTVGAVRERLTDLSPDEKLDLVDRVVLSFARWVGHLPASATYHHAGPWGLLDHSLEVAVRALSAALETRFSDETRHDPGLEYDLLPRWRYASFLFGLLHDVGKVAQISVESASGEVWNPFAGPLADFLAESGAWPDPVGKVAVSWRPGRSLEAHERHNTFFVSRIVTPEVARYLGPVLPASLEQTGGAALAMAALVGAADTESVVAERRGRLVEEDGGALPRPAFLSPLATIADSFPPALQRAMESGALGLNDPEGDAFVGDHYIALAYPGAIVKLMEAIRERWRETDLRARHLRLDQTGVKLFVRDLSFRQFLFRDRESGTWKLKATVRVGDRESKTFLVLIRKEILEAAAFRLFPGRIWFYSVIDQRPVAVDDFSVADAPSPGALPPSPPAEVPVIEPGVSHENPFIDPDRLLATLRDLVLSGKIKANVPHGACYVAKDVTYLVWPRSMVAVREALRLVPNPMEERRPYTSALSQLSAVLKDERGNVVSSIKFRPESERPCRVVRLDTRAFFQDDETLAKVGLWPDAHLIQPVETRVDR